MENAPSGRARLMESRSAATLAYVANVHSGNVSVIETMGHTVIATIPTGGLPGGVASSPDGAFVYVTDRAGAIWEIETASQTIVRRFPLPGTGGDLHHLAISPDGELAYVAGRNGGIVIAIDIRTGSVITTIPVGQLPSRIAFAPDGRFAFVVNFGSHDVSVIGTEAHSVVRTIPVATFPNDIAVTTDGSRAYVSNWGSPGSVSIIDLPTTTVVQTVGVTGAFTLDLDADDATLYVASWSLAFSGITKIATATNAIIGSIPLAANQANIELTPDGAAAYVTDFSGAAGNGNSVLVVDTQTDAMTVVDVGEAPFGMAMVVTPAANAPPTASAGGPYDGAEGTPVTLDGSGSTDPDDDVLSFDWDFGDGSARGTGVTPTHSYSDDGTYTISLTVTDGRNGTGTSTTLATIRNVAPTVHGLTGATLIAGETFSSSGFFTDPGVADTWRATVDYADGGGSERLMLDGMTFELRRTYVAPGTRNVHVSITDDDGGTGAATVNVVVQTPAEATQALGAAVQELAGQLNEGEAAALQATLAAAVDALSRGSLSAGVVQLESFVRQVEALVRRGRLSSEAGAGLTLAARRIIAAVG